jgi:uncharacterized protein with PIN domain
MKQTEFSFDSQLECFLQRDLRGKPVALAFRGRQTLKHLIESLGVPHTEVGSVKINGHPSEINTIAHDGDQVKVLPPTPAFPADPRFVLDTHLGKLTAHLRMLGFDCVYRNDYDDVELADIAEMDDRILLSRDRRLLMRKSVLRGYCLRSLDPTQQLQEVAHRFKLATHIIPFQRCIRCNHPLEPVEKAVIVDRLEPLTKKYFNDFCICPACHQIYWKGSHFDKMLKTISAITGSGKQ